MTQETRADIADQARVYALFGFVGAVAGWIGFAQRLHTELSGPEYVDFDWPLVLWLLLGVAGTVMLLVSLVVGALHNYLEAAPSAARGPADPSGV